MTYRYHHDKGIRNARVHRPINARVFRWLTVIAVAGALLSGAFVIAARQHFQAISMGYQTEELRKQSTQLEEKLRQLELDYSRAASPFEIEKRAAGLGLIRPEGSPGGSAGKNKSGAAGASSTQNRGSETQQRDSKKQ